MCQTRIQEASNQTSPPENAKGVESFIIFRLSYNITFTLRFFYFRAFF